MFVPKTHVTLVTLKLQFRKNPAPKSALSVAQKKLSSIKKCFQIEIRSDVPEFEGLNHLGVAKPN